MRHWLKSSAKSTPQRKTSGGPSSAVGGGQGQDEAQVALRRRARGKSRSASAPEPQAEDGERERQEREGVEELGREQPRPDEFQGDERHRQQGHDEASKPAHAHSAKGWWWRGRPGGSTAAAGPRLHPSWPGMWIPAAAAALFRGVTGGRHGLYLGGPGAAPGDLRAGKHALPKPRALTALRRRAHRAVGVGLGLACLAGAPAQARSGSATPDSLPAQSARLDSLAATLSRYWLTRSFSRYLFQPASQPLQEQAAVQPAVDFFTPYRDAIIRRITVLQLDVFPDSDPQAQDSFQGDLERFGQALHTETREGVVRTYFLMHAGERLDPDALADTERLLRGTSFVREAEIVPLPVEGSADSVDLLVVTRDEWSLGVDIKVKKYSRADVRLGDRNFGGWGHTLQGEFMVDADKQPAVGVVASYRLDNIRGPSCATATSSATRTARPRGDSGSCASASRRRSSPPGRSMSPSTTSRRWAPQGQRGRFWSRACGWAGPSRSARRGPAVSPVRRWWSPARARASTSGSVPIP